MKVKELLQILNELIDSHLESEEWEVVMSKDSEGNRFSPLCETSTAKYIPENSWSGELDDFDEDTEDENALCLWPTN